MTLPQALRLIAFVGLLAQLVGALLLASLFLLLRRYGAARRRYWSLWTLGWAAQVAGIVALVVRYILLPDLESGVNDRDPAVVALFFAYQLAKLAFYAALALGVRAWVRQDDAGPGSRTGAPAVAALLAVMAFAAAPLALGSGLNGLVVWHAPVALAAAGGSAVAIFRARHGRGATGPVAACACFALIAACAAVYFAAFGFAHWLHAALAPAMTAMVHYNSYVDLLLHLVLGFSMVLLLMEDVRQEMERGRRDAERAEQQARIVAEVSELFSASLDHEATLRTVARLVLPRMADSCIVYLLDAAGAVRRLEAAHVDPEREARLREYLHRHPLRPGSIFAPVARVLRTGAPELIGVLPPEEAVAEGDEPGDSALYPRSLIVAPLRVHGETLGAISFGLDGGGREYGSDDLVTAGEIARRAALAIDNARLYGETRQAVHAREQVLQIVSHDLRNPLGVIMLNTGIALESVGGADGDTRAALEGVVVAAGQMNRLIENLVDLARMDAGHMSLERQPHPAASLVRAAVAMLRPLAETHAQRLEHDVAEGLPPVWLEADRLLQVLSNLVGNAIKFTPEGGRIVVSAARMGDDVRFSVADTGPGIPDEHQPFLFDRFWQADRSRRGGTGLGLAIAKGIVEAHGGRIWVESRLLEGSTFHFTVPVYAEAEG